MTVPPGETGPDGPGQSQPPGGPRGRTGRGRGGGEPTSLDPGRTPRGPRQPPRDRDATALDPGRVRRGRYRGRRDRNATTLDPGRVWRGRGEREQATRLDPGRGGGAGDIRPPGAGRFPPGLARRFAVISDLPGSGAEATLHLVRERGDNDNPQRVLKLYFAGRVPDERVWTWLRGRTPDRAGQGASHIVTLFEADWAARQAYELMEYLAGGDLYEMLERSPFRLGPDPLTAVVAQVSAALAEAHAAGIWHLDVKPDNILARSLDPLDVALTDFGISTIAGEGGPAHNLSREMTPRYAAPEWLIADDLSAAVDWWALGMTVAELASGRHPFAGYEVPLIRAHFASARPVDLAGVTDPRLRLLCRGLLAQDPADRWGQEQIQRWLAGETPDVADHAPERDDTGPDDGPPPRPAFSYQGTDYHDPAQLAIALAEDWEFAAGRFFVDRKTARQFWAELSDWLAALEDPQHTVASLRDLGKALDKSGQPPDVELHRLLRWLHPRLPPGYRRVLITASQLPVLAQHAIGDPAGTAPDIGADAAADIVAECWRYHLLSDLADAPRGTGLAEIDARWRHLHERWEWFTESHVSRYPEARLPLRDVPDTTIHGYLLWLAASEPTARSFLRTAATRYRAALPADLTWFSVLTAPDADVISLLAAVLLANAAHEAAQRIAEDEWAARVRRRRMLQGQAVAAWHRQHDRPTALGWAAAGAAIVAVFWSWAIGLSDVLPFASVSAVATAWASAILSFVVFAGAETWLAAVIGGPYHPRYSLVGRLGSNGARVLRPLRDRGLILLAIVACAVVSLIATTIYLPYLLPLASTLGQIVWTRARYRRWLADQADREEELRLAAREQREELMSQAG